MGFNASQLAVASLDMGIAGGITSTAGSLFEAIGERENLKTQAKLSEVNAQLAKIQAASAIDAGQRRAAAAGLKAGQIKGAQRAALAANGVAIDTGSAADLQAGTDLMKRVDMDAIMDDAMGQAWGYQTQASNYTIDAIMKNATAKSIKPALAAGTTLLSSATSVAKQWYSLHESGVLKDTRYELR